MATANTNAMQTSALGGPISTTFATEGIRIPRATGGPVLDLDLMTMVEQLRHESAWSDGRNSRTLVKHGDFRMVLTVMRAGACLHRHHARGTVLIQVLSGQIQARILNEVVEAPAGHALSLDPDLEHEIEAVQESALLITIAWPRDFAVIRKKPVAAPMRRLALLCTIADHIDAATRAESGVQ